MWTDGFFTIPALRLAEAQTRAGGRAWMYRLSWPTPVLGGVLGACHALDLPFAFDRVGAPEWARFLGDAPPVALGQDIHSAWVRFASTGDPNGGTLAEWPPYDLSRRAAMVFDTPIRVLDDPGMEERTLWDGIWECLPDQTEE